MRHRVFCLPFIVAGLIAGSTGIAQSEEGSQLSEAASLKLTRIIETRGFTRGLPRRPMPSPNGKRVYFLRSEPKSSTQAIYSFDVNTGKSRLMVTAKQLSCSEKVSVEEQARRERQRETEGGITRFTVTDDGEKLLVPYSGDLFLVDTRGGRVHRITNTPEAEIDAHLSPDGQKIAFVRNQTLFVRDIASGREVAPQSDFATGIAEFVAQEEMGRSTGHWWSPDSRYVAFTEVDSRDVPLFRVPNFNSDTGEGYFGAYPKAGDANARVRLGVVDVSAVKTETAKTPSGARRVAPLWLPQFSDDFEYLNRVQWSPASDALWTQSQPRSQQRLDLHRYEIENQKLQLVLQENDPTWINLDNNFRLLEDGQRFLRSTERTGHRHLEILGADGKRQRTLTTGDWEVVRVLHVDEKRGDIYFSAHRGDVRELHVYRVPLRGGAIKRTTDQPGWHTASFHKRGNSVFVDRYSDTDITPQFLVRNRSGKILGKLPSNALTPTVDDLGPRPEFVRATTTDGVQLDMIVTQPPNVTQTAEAQGLPLIVYVYGGPHAQQVRRRWGGERGLIDSWLAERGYIVVRIDGRGVWARGHEEESIYYRHMGKEELADQVAGIKILQERYPIDPQRIGVWGWSYGGYMTLMALMQQPDIFRAGVSVAPVVDWRGYDTHYTERYLGTPQDNPEGYDASSVLSYVKNLTGHLTLVHGASDDNVHMRESMVLVNKLVSEGKEFDLMIYPGTHMIQSLEERTHLYKTLWRAFQKHL